MGCEMLPEDGQERMRKTAERERERGSEIDEQGAVDGQKEQKSSVNRYKGVSEDPGKTC